MATYEQIHLEDDRKLYEFLTNQRRCYSGYRISQLHRLPNIALEFSHAYIQWMFPLTNPSRHDLRAPYIHCINNVVTEETIKSVRESLRVMCRFYGFTMTETAIYQSDSFQTRAKWWLSPGNHNFERLTRILKSLRIFGLQNEAELLYKELCVLQKDYPIILEQPMQYWIKAMLEEMV